MSGKQKERKKVVERGQGGGQTWTDRSMRGSKKRRAETNNVLEKVYMNSNFCKVHRGGINAQEVGSAAATVRRSSLAIFEQHHLPAHRRPKTKTAAA